MKNKTKTGIRRGSLTVLRPQKLKLVILQFLDQREADMVSDYQPDSEIWRQELADALAAFIVENY